MEENGIECCELCGSEDLIIHASIHVDVDEDDTVDDEAFVCLNCWTRYKDNMEMFLDIVKARLEQAEAEEQDELGV